MIDDDIKH